MIAQICRIVLQQRPFDRDRALRHLLDIVPARIPEAAAARDLLTDESCVGSAQVRVVAMLAQIRDEDGLDLARPLLADRRVPVAYRAWLAQADPGR